MTATTFQQALPQWVPPPEVFEAGQTARVPNKQGDVVLEGQAVQKPISPALEGWLLSAATKECPEASHEADPR